MKLGPQGTKSAGWAVFTVNHHVFPVARGTVEIFTQNFPAVYIFVAVGAQIFPVAAIRGIVVMVAVFVMNGQEMSISMIKFSAAPRAYQAVNRKRAFPVVFPRRLFHALFHFPHNVTDRLLRLRFVAPDSRSYTPCPVVKRNLCQCPQSSLFSPSGKSVYDNLLINKGKKIVNGGSNGSEFPEFLLQQICLEFLVAFLFFSCLIMPMISMVCMTLFSKLGSQAGPSRLFLTILNGGLIEANPREKNINISPTSPLPRKEESELIWEVSLI